MTSSMTARVSLVLAMCVVFVGGGIAAYAVFPPSSADKVDACFNTSRGNLRVIADPADGCNDRETPISFLGANAKADDADNLDGMDSSEFLTSTSKAADADKLDGKDSTEFVRDHGFVTGSYTLPTGPFTFTAQCPTGQGVTGGGYTLPSSGVTVTASRPNLAGVFPFPMRLVGTGWQVTGDASGGSITIYAICAGT